jgi:hypothetical protein
MKAQVISIGLLMLITGPAAADVLFEIAVVDQGGSQNVLLATTEGRTYRISDPAWDDLVLRGILETGDFDGDGLTDALVNMDTGGNCCPQDFAIISYRGDGFFAALGPPVSMGWGGIDVTMDADGLMIRSHHVSQGFGNADDAEWQVDYRIREGAITEVARRENVARLVATPELTMDQVLDGSEAVLTFDLNGDGSDDAIACRYWDRWGVLNCSITAAGVGPAGALACTRVGVLQTMQNGWHELSCGRRGVAVWSEGEYSVP